MTEVQPMGVREIWRRRAVEIGTVAAALVILAVSLGAAKPQHVPSGAEIKSAEKKQWGAFFNDHLFCRKKLALRKTAVLSDEEVQRLYGLQEQPHFISLEATAALATYAFRSDELRNDLVKRIPELGACADSNVRHSAVSLATWLKQRGFSSKFQAIKAELGADSNSVEDAFLLRAIDKYQRLIDM